MKQYTKLVIARHSPENRCNAPDGAVLYVKPLRKVPMRNYVNHYFLDTFDRSTRSKFGWVKESKPFTIQDFLRIYLKGEEVPPDELFGIEKMLESITNLAPDTPVAVTYSCVGVEAKEMVLTIHRVFFYSA
jgi:hypothetical protein